MVQIIWLQFSVFTVVASMYPFIESSLPVIFLSPFPIFFFFLRLALSWDLSSTDRSDICELWKFQEELSLRNARDCLWLLGIWKMLDLYGRGEDVIWTAWRGLAVRGGEWVGGVFHKVCFFLLSSFYLLPHISHFLFCKEKWLHPFVNRMTSLYNIIIVS